MKKAKILDTPVVAPKTIEREELKDGKLTTVVYSIGGDVAADPKVHPLDCKVGTDEMAAIKRPLICKKAIAILRDEIEAELPKIRNLDAGTSMFCDEVLRAINGLENNQDSYREKLLIEARHRAANSQEKK